MTATGLPHSEIPGSKLVDSSPRLIAVFHVLHRLLMPRHPSCARIRLARNFPRQSRYVVILHNSTIKLLLSKIKCSTFLPAPLVADPVSGERVHIIPYFEGAMQEGISKKCYIAINQLKTNAELSLYKLNLAPVF